MPPVKHNRQARNRTLVQSRTGSGFRACWHRVSGASRNRLSGRRGLPRRRVRFFFRTKSFWPCRSSWCLNDVLQTSSFSAVTGCRACRRPFLRQVTDDRADALPCTAAGERLNETTQAHLAVWNMASCAYPSHVRQHGNFKYGKPIVGGFEPTV